MNVGGGIVASAIIALAIGCDSSTTVPGDPTSASADLVVDGRGDVVDRYTAELWVSGNTAYTTTWGARTVNDVRSVGNAIKIWNVSGSTPLLADSVIVPDATTLGDIQASDDGRLLIAATEGSLGSIVIYDIADPLKPRFLSRFTNDNTARGVHTAEVQRVNGKLYAFLCVDPGPGEPAKLVIVDLSNPAVPVEVFARAMGNPFVHDVFVRDGILMTALWNDGISIFDIGGGGKGGSISAPVLLGNTRTVGGRVHNIWWFHDPVTGSKRYAFIGEEAPGSIGASSMGDIHVVDVSDLSNPREIAFYSVMNGGTHNFSMDEGRGVLYAAYYNAGVRALNIRGDLGSCSASEKDSGGRCDIVKMNREIAHGLSAGTIPVYIWGVQLAGGKLYASDMLNGLWKLEPAP